MVKSIGLAFNGDNTLIKFDGTFWSKENDNNQLVDNSNSYFSKSSTGVIGFNMPTNLYYDGCQLPNQPYSSYANNSCNSKTMRIPSTNEVSATNNTYIQSCGGWTWTSTYYGIVDGYNSIYYMWQGNGFSYDGFGYWSQQVRCVK